MDISSPFLTKTSGPGVTAKPNIFRLPRREVTKDVWKYLQDIAIGLYAGSDPKLAHPKRARSPDANLLPTITALSTFPRLVANQ